MRKIPTQIALDEPMYNAVKALAEKRGWTMAQIVREALETYLKKEEKR
ncbi:MAG: ribbon-helix-helix domain-containing protein [Syntrophaceae bacterium]